MTSRADTGARAVLAPRAVLAIDGIDGSGKSVFARRLAETATAMGTDTVTFAVDDFRRPIDWRADGRAEAEIYYEDYYDLHRLDGCLTAFLRGDVAVQIPVFDSLSHRLDGQREIDCGAATLGLVEGVFALRAMTVAACAPLVYLQTSFATARQRIEVRDTARGRTLTEVSHRISMRYFPAQERYLREFDPAARAHIVIDNEDLSSPRLVRFDGDAVADQIVRQAPASPSTSVAAVAPAAPEFARGIVALLSRACAGFARPTTVG